MKFGQVSVSHQPSFLELTAIHERHSIAMRVFCDFDGTVTLSDTTDHVLSMCADPSWRVHEQAWIEGRMTAADCMRAQIALLDVDEARLVSVLDGCQLRPGFEAFVSWCGAANIPLTIVSDGVDYFIKRILERLGLGDLPVISNELALQEGRYTLLQPHAREGCAAGSGVCKCAAVDESSIQGPVVIIGDGRSDFCLSAQADVLFARAALADYAAERKQTYIAFETFDDVMRELSRLNARRQSA